MAQCSNLKGQLMSVHPEGTSGSFVNEMKLDFKRLELYQKLNFALTPVSCLQHPTKLLIVSKCSHDYRDIMRSHSKVVLANTNLPVT